eukprot:73708_1
MNGAKQAAWLFFFASQANLTSARWFGWGGGHGGGMGFGSDHGGMKGMKKSEMMEMIHNLLDHRKEIDRSYINTNDGIESSTSSDNADVASWIQIHVYQMMTLMESEGGVIRRWDELFETMFDLRGFHEMAVTNTTYGVDVVQEVISDKEMDGSKAKCTKALIQKHAEVVSNFVDHGWDEMHRNHPVPSLCAGM